MHVYTVTPFELTSLGRAGWFSASLADRGLASFRLPSSFIFVIPGEGRDPV